MHRDIIYRDISARLDILIKDAAVDTTREQLIERLDKDCDNSWGFLVKTGRIDEYTVDDLVETAKDCADIIEFATENAWVENDRGLWVGKGRGLDYGILASIAYFSLRNCFYQLLADRGYSSNDEAPFATKSS